MNKEKKMFKVNTLIFIFIFTKYLNILFVLFVIVL